MGSGYTGNANFGGGNNGDLNFGDGNLSGILNFGNGSGNFGTPTSA